jgi:hypothetical protein
MTFPLQMNLNNGVGDLDRRMLNLNIQPVVPFQAGDWNLITRTIIPVNSVPIGATDAQFGLGDTNFSLFFSPAKAASLTWGLGPIVSFPSSSNPEVLGSGKWSIGPTGVLFASAGAFTLGGVANNLWSIAGDDDRDDVNFFFMQYFINFNFGSGWALGTAPIVTANWEAESGEQWTVPWGLQLSRITRLGSQPVNLLLGYYVNSEHPTGGPEEQVRFQINFMYPTAQVR